MVSPIQVIASQPDQPFLYHTIEDLGAAFDSAKNILFKASPPAEKNIFRSCFRPVQKNRPRREGLKRTI
jgi:hypothetical protein